MPEKVHYEAPPSDAVPAEMERLIEWCNTANQSPTTVNTAMVAAYWHIGKLIVEAQGGEAKAFPTKWRG